MDLVKESENKLAEQLQLVQQQLAQCLKNEQMKQSQLESVIHEYDELTRKLKHICQQKSELQMRSKAHEATGKALSDEATYEKEATRFKEILKLHETREKGLDGELSDQSVQRSEDVKPEQVETDLALARSCQNENELQMTFTVADEGVVGKEVEMGSNEALRLEHIQDSELRIEVSELQKKVNEKEALIQIVVGRAKDLQDKLDRLDKLLEDQNQLQGQLQRLRMMNEALERESRLDGEQLLERTILGINNDTLKKCFQTLHNELVNLDISFVVDYLFSNFIITVDNYRQLTMQPDMSDTKKQAQQLLAILYASGHPEAFIQLLEGLSSDICYTFFTDKVVNLAVKQNMPTESMKTSHESRDELTDLSKQADGCDTYRCNPRLATKLNPKYRLWGVTQLDDKIFVVSHGSDKINVFGLNYEQLSQIKVEGLKLPQDIAACSETKSLYVADWRSHGFVWRVSTDGKVKVSIPVATTSRFRSLSVTSGRLLMTTEDDELLLYGADGIELKRLSFTYISMIKHAVETRRGTFVLCHWKPQPEVIEVDHHGQVISQSIYNDQQQLTEPCYLSFDSSGKLFVADWQKHHILMLTGNLKCERVLLDNEHNGLAKYPHRISYVQRTGHLIVAGYGLRFLISPVVHVFAVG